MTTALKILLLEDNPDDVELVRRALRSGGVEPVVRSVDNQTDYLAALAEKWDLVISDYHLPQFTGLKAVQLLRERGDPMPFIMISGTIGEETAVEAMRYGVTDYLLKDRLARLPAAVERALEQASLRRERQLAVEALNLFRTLVDQSSDGFEVIDLATGKFLDVNETDCRELGYTRAELLRMGVADIDPNATGENWAGFARKLQAEGRASGQGTHRRKDGTHFPIEFNARLVRLGRDYLVSAVRNITTRRQAEEAMQNQLDELQRWHEVTLNREDRILELKREVNDLLAAQNQAARYTVEPS